jgi:hypothetical protein
MLKKLLLLLCCFAALAGEAQMFVTPYEKSGGRETATYAECIAFYKKLDTRFPTISMDTVGLTDAGYPLHIVYYTDDARFSPVHWAKMGKLIILINNGIHPGEPDGIDATMMLLRDAAEKRINIPRDVVLAVIPIYNVGGALNRNNTTRVNQNGPASYGFRGNARNLDLNRDFIKSDSRNARAFASIFQRLDPDILIDNHVSDGADYQHTMTLLTTQTDKIGADLGHFIRDTLEPALYAGMERKKIPMCPYVNFETADPNKGWQSFYDPPRYSSGYAALFQTIAFVPETHMLKPFPDRVKATYELCETIIQEAGRRNFAIRQQRYRAKQEVIREKSFPLRWTADTVQHRMIQFMGYEAGYKTSGVTGMQRLYYDRSKPYTMQVRYFDTYRPDKFITKPQYYVIPRGWHNVTELLQLNNVRMEYKGKDTTLQVTTYRIEDYKSAARPYESHHRNYDVKITRQQQSVRINGGYYLVPMNQPANRYIMEVLEPEGEDSFFSWNFFDAILQQKEGYSDYRWEDIAAEYLDAHPELRAQLEEKKKNDPQFAKSAGQQLYFVYRNSPWYEASHLRYPVYRID